jgi:hypothetical protein
MLVSALHLNPNTIQWEAIKGLPSETFWFIFSGLSLFLVFSLYQAYKITIKAREIENTPTSKIRSAAQGWVELEGEQHFFKGSPLIAPLSNIPCTWYYYSIEYYKKKGWVEIERGTSQSLLILDDETGQCIVDPTGATITPGSIDSWGGFNSRPNGKPKSWLGKLIGSFGHYRYKEYRMDDGCRLYAIGYFKTIPLREAPEIIKQAYKAETPIDTIHILTQETATARQPYVLSAQTQKHTVRKLRRDGSMWVITYLSLFAVLSLLLIARMS